MMEPFAARRQPARHGLGHEEAKARRLRFMTRSKSSTFTSRKGEVRLVPALLISTWKAAARRWPLPRSHEIGDVEDEGSALPPLARIEAAAASISAAVRETSGHLGAHFG